MSRGWLKWAVLAAIALVLATGVLRALSARKARQAALSASVAAQARTVVDLADADVVRVMPREIIRSLPISGTLRAVGSAVVKARVAGELQGLTVREGDTVRAGQLLARIAPAEYQSRMRQVQEQADSAKAQVDIAKRQYENNRALVEQGFISQTTLDTSLANLNAASATHRAARAAVEMSRKSLDDTLLRAPISGQVSLRVAQPGEHVGVDAKVLEIVDLSRLELEAALSAADSIDVRVGQRALLRIEGRERPVPARVARINPSAQTGSRSVLVYLALEDSAGLRQGLFAQGPLDTGRTTALAVPLSSVRTDKPAPYVQLLQDGQVLHRVVQTGVRGNAQGQDGETLVALQGVPEGSLVLAGGVGTLREGTAVRLTGGQTAEPAVAAGALAASGAKPPRLAP